MKATMVRVCLVFTLLVFLSACARDSSVMKSTGPAVGGVVRVVHSSYLRHIILASVYDYLYKPGVEPHYYGLYSYVLFPVYSARAEGFLEELFKTTGFAAGSLIDVGNLNLIYLPTRVDQLPSLLSMISGGSAPQAKPFATQFYDYNLSQKLLAQICAAPADEIRDLCATDLSHGPYVFTYVRPASTLSLVPPPYLFLDLSNVHIRAFGEFIPAYKAQIKRSDYSDRELVATLRLRVLNRVYPD